MTSDPVGYRRGPVGEQVLALLAAGPHVIAELAEACGHTPPLIEGVLRGLARRRLVVDEADGRIGVRVWRLAGEPRT